MKLSDFDFDLPEGLIATRPARPRSSARLLVAEGQEIRDVIVRDLPDQLRPGDRLILNNTRVIPARLTGTRTRATGQGDAVARLEVTLLEPRADGTWSALAKPLRKLKAGETLVFSPELSARVVEISGGQCALAFNLTGEDFDAALAEADALLQALRDRGIDFTEVTLHVGAGTFLPVKVDDVTTHKMHAEWGEVSTRAAEEINATRRAGGRIIPVGTTALRLIESAAAPDGTMHSWQGSTDIFIYPGYSFRVTDALMTNFHLPKSTLLMLVSALMGQDRIRRVYDHAVAENYRFFSYGDASLLIP